MHWTMSVLGSSPLRSRRPFGAMLLGACDGEAQLHPANKARCPLTLLENNRDKPNRTHVRD
jgi:hypothetical protein